MDIRNLKIIKNKDGHGTMGYKIALPSTWIKSMGLDESNYATLIFKDNSILIKNKEDIDMKDLMKEKLVEDAYNGYVEMNEDENKIVIDLNSFNYCEECKNDDGELDLKLIEELNKKLIDLFEKNEYDVYEAGGIYAEDGQMKNVNPNTAVAIKRC